MLSAFCGLVGWRRGDDESLACLSLLLSHLHVRRVLESCCDLRHLFPDE